MRTLSLAAPFTLLALGAAALLSSASARADAPLRPPEKHVARSPNATIAAESDPASGLTTVYRVAPDGTRERRWAMAGWFRAIYPADDGDHLVVGFDGLNLLPRNAADDLVVLRFVRRGEAIRALTLRDVVPDRSILKRTASHLAWRESERFDAKGRFVVVTIDGAQHRYDVKTGLALADDTTGPASALERLAGWMTGTFSNAAQAKADPEFGDTELHVARIWRARADAAWFYVEQAPAKSPASPFRQHVYRVRALADGILEWRAYEPPEPAKVVGAWQDERLLAALAPDGLAGEPGCAFILRARDERTFAGSTLGSQCPSTLRGALYATSDVTVTADGLVLRHRGFDPTGAPVWGSTKGGSRFDRVEAAGGAPAPSR